MLSSPQHLARFVRVARTYTASFEIAKAAAVHQPSDDVHSHERPPIQHVYSTVSDCNIVHLVNGEACQLLHSTMPMLHQRVATHWSREHAPTNGVIFGIGHGEHGASWPTSGEDMVPIALHEVCADTMDLMEAFVVTDSELIRSNANVRSVLLM